MKYIITSILFFPALYLFYNIFLYFFTKVPIIITPKKYYKQLFDNYKINKGSIIYELGCGRGDFLFAVEKLDPEKIIGYELSLMHVLEGKILAKLRGSKARICCKNYFLSDISDADFIYLFLVTPVLAKTWAKIKNETKPGTIVAVLSDKIPGEKYFKKIPTKPWDPKTTHYHLYKV